MGHMDIEEWFNELTGKASLRDAASRAGSTKSTLSRQIDKGRLSPEMVISLCRAYNRSPITGLIETGYIQPWETQGVSIPYALEQATNQQILDEIIRRSDPEARKLFTNETYPQAVDLPTTLTKSNKTTPDVSPEFYDDGTVRPFDHSIPHAADSSPDEDKLRWKEENPGDTDF